MMPAAGEYGRRYQGFLCNGAVNIFKPQPARIAVKAQNNIVGGCAISKVKNTLPAAINIADIDPGFQRDVAREFGIRQR